MNEASIAHLPRPVRVAIIGATGYGGAELIRQLAPRPDIALTRLIAKDGIGKRIGDIHLSLAGLQNLAHLRVEDAEPEAVAPDADVVFIGLPHRVSAQVGAKYSDLGCADIDLSGDYRLRDLDAYQHYYEAQHPHPERLGTFVYGLPEFQRAAIAKSRRIASPGCFATTIALALWPLARAGLLTGRVQVSAMTGSSGSGANPQLGTHHPLRAQTLRPYKPLGHQHVPEIIQTLTDEGARDLTLEFVPVSAPLVRGILATCFVEVPAEVDAERLKQLLHDAYDSEKLIRVLDNRLPEVNAVAGSMFVEIAGTAGEAHNGKRTVVLHAALDNLIKGGAGQAVQSLNVMLGIDEFTGLLQPAQWP